MREIAKVAFRLFLIMILAGLCLGATYTVTKDPIAQQELLQQEADRRAVLPETATFEEVAIEPTGAVTACFRGIGTHSEPPGLGAKAADDSFLSQFTGKGGELTVNKNGAQNDSEISAITAATITSRAVTSAVNEAVALAGSLE